MSNNHDPAVQRRRLRSALREIRKGLGLTQRAVASALDWSPSKLLRIENGAVNISKSDLIALLGHYGISDQDRIAELIDMAQTAKTQSWASYRDIWSPEFMTYLGYEGSASVMRQYQPLLVPGLLQTEEYARTIIGTLSTRQDETVDGLERRVQARMERQELLGRDDAPAMHFILDEAVVARRVGSAATMIRQLEHLITASKNEKVVIQVVPFQAGAHPGMRGPFILLEFADPDLDDLLYLEHARGDVVSVSGGDEIATAAEAFLTLEDLSSPKSRLTETIEKAIAAMRVNE